MANHCRICKIEIPEVGLTGKPKLYCCEKHKTYFTNHIRHFDIDACRTDASACKTEDHMREWAKVWCVDNKGSYRKKIFEDLFATAIGLENFIGMIKELIEFYPDNDKLKKPSEQFNAWINKSSRKICPVCNEGWPSFNQTEWRKYCSEKCCNAAKRSGGAIRTSIDDTCVARYGVKGGLTPERIEQFATDREWRIGVRNPMQIPDNVRAALETKKLNGQFAASQPESEIKEFIEGLGLTCEQSNYSILNGKQIDLFVPERNLAIEYNGCYFHSEANKGVEFARVRHVEKTEACEAQGIQLLHIWEDEWVSDKDKVLNMIKAKLGIAGKRIYARKTKLLNDVNPHELYNKVHIQGFGNGSVTYGLEYEGELVAAMSFIKRPQSGVWELNRYAGVNVAGGFTKLLRAFQREQEWSKIVSFGDRCVVYRHSNVYVNNGFTEVGINPPDYKYTSGKCDRHHKFKFRKANLIKKYGFDSSMTEYEMAHASGFYRIYNAGLIKYEITK